MNESTQKSNRLTLLLIVAMFATPILAAIYLNSQWSDWAPETTRNHGQLVQPVLALPAGSVRAVRGDLDQLHQTGKWILLQVTRRCETRCQQTLVQMRQVHLATGFNSGKVAEALVLSERPDQELLDLLATDFPLLSILHDDGSLLTYLSGTLTAATALYLVDPLGNVMMRYPPGFDASGLKQDLGRLLRYNKTSPSST